MIDIKEFQNRYIEALLNDSAAIFAGAGLGISSGYLNWKELLRGIATAIKLDIDKESDLIEVAQFYKNERGVRSGINDLILNEFKKIHKENQTVQLLADMPISCYWTTNYDQIIEQALAKTGKKFDVKITPSSLSSSLTNSDAVVYKMHGDCSDPANCVITKEDYETYNQYRNLFTIALQGHLVSKTFLFIGFSFEDPNLNYILSRIRSLIGENVREHYFFIEKLKRKDKQTEKDFEYSLRKQELKINDLKRYGIQAVMLDSYNQIPEILNHIKLQSKTKNVFISGAANTYGEAWSEKGCFLVKALTELLYKNDYRIVTGHARGIGSFVISTILEKAQSNVSLLDSHLLIKAFPYEDKKNKHYEDLITEYREGIAKTAGIVIFMFGNKIDDNGQIVPALGMLKEFEKAKNENCYIIPIGSTGFIAKEIFDLVKTNLNDYPYLDEKDMVVLGQSINIKDIIEKIDQILARIKQW